MSVNVLVVDDSDVIRTMILKTMRLADIPLGSAYEASNGREALEVLEDNWVDVVLADLNMPIMDGIEMIERIRATDSFADVPVVVISTEGAESRMARLRELGVEAYLRKPFTPEQVRDVINDVAGRVTGAEHRDVLESAMTHVLGQFAMMYAEAVESAGEAPPAGIHSKNTPPQRTDRQRIVRSRINHLHPGRNSLRVQHIEKRVVANDQGVDIRKMLKAAINCLQRTGSRDKCLG